MLEVKISFTAECPDGAYDELKQIVENHIDYLIDFDANRDIIESVYGAKAEICED